MQDDSLLGEFSCEPKIWAILEETGFNLLFFLLFFYSY